MHVDEDTAARMLVPLLLLSDGLCGSLHHVVEVVLQAPRLGLAAGVQAPPGAPELLQSLFARDELPEGNAELPCLVADAEEQRLHDLVLEHRRNEPLHLARAILQQLAELLPSAVVPDHGIVLLQPDVPAVSPVLFLSEQNFGPRRSGGFVPELRIVHGPPQVFVVPRVGSHLRELLSEVVRIPHFLRPLRVAELLFVDVRQLLGLAHLPPLLVADGVRIGHAKGCGNSNWHMPLGEQIGASAIDGQADPEGTRRGDGAQGGRPSWRAGRLRPGDRLQLRHGSARLLIAVHFLHHLRSCLCSAGPGTCNVLCRGHAGPEEGSCAQGMAGGPAWH
mmetsp:Transcript_45421/g.145745  ORF Transcript_45421/g.145745 Transcript_45421/m.145745 type:complete len:334 (+) Transcript_45421:1063-2064(+)